MIFYFLPCTSHHFFFGHFLQASVCSIFNVDILFYICLPPFTLHYQTTRAVRRILTSLYWVFSPNWICHSKPPPHTITSLRPTPAGRDATTQSRYMWMVGTPSVSVSLCVSYCVFVCFPFPGYLLQDSFHHAVVALWSILEQKSLCWHHVVAHSTQLLHR